MSVEITVEDLLNEVQALHEVRERELLIDIAKLRLLTRKMQEQLDIYEANAATSSAVEEDDGKRGD